MAARTGHRAQGHSSHLVAGQVAAGVRPIAKGERKSQQVEAHSGRACIDQDEHRNVLGEAGAHTPDGDLHSNVSSAHALKDPWGAVP